MINTGIPKSSASTEEPNYSEPSEVGFPLGTVVGSVLSITVKRVHCCHYV